jgi:hypothetical protein
MGPLVSIFSGKLKTFEVFFFFSFFERTVFRHCVGLVRHCVGRLSHERLVNEGNREGSIVFYVDRLGAKYLRGDCR